MSSDITLTAIRQRDSGRASGWLTRTERDRRWLLARQDRMVALLTAAATYVRCPNQPCECGRDVLAAKIAKELSDV